MQNSPDTFETPKRSFISAFSICMTVPLILGILALYTCKVCEMFVNKHTETIKYVKN